MALQRFGVFWLYEWLNSIIRLCYVTEAHVVPSEIVKIITGSFK